MLKYRHIIGPFVLVLVAGWADLAPAQSEPERRKWMYHQYRMLPEYVRGGLVEPRWLDDGQRFWYVEHGAEERPVFLVDTPNRVRRHLFDFNDLQEELKGLLGDEAPGSEPSLNDLALSALDQDVLELVVGSHSLEFNVRSGQLRRLADAPPSPMVARWNESVAAGGTTAARIQAHNVWLRSLRDGSEETLTTDGTLDRAWGGPRGRGPQISWSPDGSKLAIARLDRRAVTKIPIVSYLNDSSEVRWVHSWESRGPFETTELFIFNVETKDRVRARLEPAVGAFPELIYILGWSRDGAELLFAKVTRDFRRLSVAAVDGESGAVRTLLNEERDTFFHIPWYRPLTATMFEQTDQFVWLSARNGWNHLYLYDLRGNLVGQLTDGPYEVVKVVRVDQETGWIYFTAHSDPVHPYDTHLLRTNLHGNETQQLTVGRGVHDVALSPTSQFFVDTYKNVNLMPVVELRSTDGRLIDTLSVAELHPPQGFVWVEPEEFVVTATDGATKLHGVLYKPFDFDPALRYPVIEIMVGRPNVSVNEMLRTHWLGGEALAQLGFIVLALDGRGTPERGHAFHSKVHRVMGQYEIPDHVTALQQLSGDRPYMDLSRVGITGASYGGYYAIRAMLQAPETYKVAVAVAPYDPRGDAVIAYMGLPQDNSQGYAHASNVGMAERLQGHLLILHGSADASAQFRWTMDLIQAFNQARKPVDLLILPDEGHGFRPQSRAYAREAARRYFEEHLRPAETDGSP